MGEPVVEGAARWADGINGFSFGPSREEVDRVADLLG